MDRVSLTTLPLGVICHHRLDIAYVYTKFDNSSFCRFRDMICAPNDLNGSRDLTTTLSGIVCHLWASTCYDQPIYQNQTLIDVSMSMASHYEHMKGDTKCEKWRVRGSYGFC